jgi:hypothetical protein
LVATQSLEVLLLIAQLRAATLLLKDSLSLPREILSPLNLLPVALGATLRLLLPLSAAPFLVVVIAIPIAAIAVVVVVIIVTPPIALLSLTVPITI